MKETKINKKLFSDSHRVILQFFNPGSPARINNVIDRVLSLTESETALQLEKIMNDFSTRHLNFKDKLLDNFNNICNYIDYPESFSLERKLLIGAYFSKEYSIEAAALFNPSIIPHPVQGDLKPGMLRFILSLRAAGEGHISSIEFRTGIIDENNKIFFDTPSRYADLPKKNEQKLYTKQFLKERIKVENIEQKEFIDDLPEQFTKQEIKDILSKYLLNKDSGNPISFEDSVVGIIDSNYDINFDSSTSVSERVIFPQSVNESVGMEDARFVKFTGDVGEENYYATYTAYNGRTFGTQLIETKDFLKFNIRTLHGSGVKDKGMALFPRKINGKYVITSRQGGENLYIMFSDDLHTWNDFKLLRMPKEPWEFVQLGNCGSPIETKEGWLLITHAVGPFRKYSISACLLALNDPSKVIGTLKSPLIEPDENEREGYVPNAIYSCGSIIHNDELIIPYAMADSYIGFTKISVDELLKNILT